VTFRGLTFLITLLSLAFPQQATQGTLSTLGWSDLVNCYDHLVGAQHLDSGMTYLPEILMRAERAMTVLDTILERQSKIPLFYQYDPRYYEKAEATAMDKLRRLSDSANAEFEVAECWLGLAEIHRVRNRRTECLAALGEAESVAASAPGVDSATAYKALLIKGALFEDNSDYATADSLYLQAQALAQIRHGPESHAVAKAFAYLGRAKYCLGKYAEAELFLRKSILLCDKLGCYNCEDRLSAMSTLVLTLVATDRMHGNGNLLRSLLQRAQQNNELPPVVLSRALAAAGVLTRRTGRYVESQIAFALARRIDTATLGSEHPLAAIDMLRLGALYWGTKRLHESELMIDSALTILARGLPEDHVEFGNACLYRGSLYAYAGDSAAAARTLNKGLSILTRRLGDGHPRTLDILTFCAQLSADRGQSTEALELISRIFDGRMEIYLENSVNVTLHDSWFVVTDLRESVDSYLLTYFDLVQPSTWQTRCAAEMMITAKGLAIAENLLSKDQRQADTDWRSKEEYSQYEVLSVQLDQARAKDPFMQNITTLDAVDSLCMLMRVMELENHSVHSGTRRSVLVEAVDVDSICARIPMDAVLVEFYNHLHYFPTVKDSAENRCIAIILKRDGLHSVKSLGRYIEDDLQPIQECLAQPANSREARRELVDMLRWLYDSFWAPIAESAGNSSLVLFSPEYPASYIPLPLFLGPDDRFLIEKHAVCLIPAARLLDEVPCRDAKNSGLLVLGDPDHDATADQRLAAMSGFRPTRALASFSTNSEFRSLGSDCQPFITSYMSRLSGTRNEIELISGQWGIHSREPLLRYSGAAASEDAFKHYAPRHRVLHIAAHGYFLPVSCVEHRGAATINGNDPYALRNQLLDSGLLLAGSNWHGGGLGDSGLNDGILTAAEVNEMELDGVDLAVLSSCYSSNGAPSLGQGTWGLRDCLWAAGVKTVVGATWEIPDAQTADYMAGLYSMPDLTVPDALRSLAIDAIEKYRHAGEFPDPFYWASFVCFGDWRTKIAGY